MSVLCMENYEHPVIQQSAFTTPVQLCRAFVLAPNTKIDVMWAPWNPHAVVKCKRQGDSKVMACCGMVDGLMLAVKWVVDENGRPHSVTSQRY